MSRGIDAGGISGHHSIAEGSGHRTVRVTRWDPRHQDHVTAGGSDPEGRQQRFPGDCICGGLMEDHDEPPKPPHRLVDRIP